MEKHEETGLNLVEQGFKGNFNDTECMILSEELNENDNLKLALLNRVMAEMTLKVLMRTQRHLVKQVG